MLLRKFGFYETENLSKHKIIVLLYEGNFASIYEMILITIVNRLENMYKHESELQIILFDKNTSGILVHSNLYFLF